MKTLREIQDYVANDYGYISYEHIMEHITQGIVSPNFTDDYLQDCFIEVQKQQQILIEQNVAQSIINDKNIIR